MRVLILVVLVAWVLLAWWILRRLVAAAAKPGLWEPEDPTALPDGREVVAISRREPSGLRRSRLVVGYVPAGDPDAAARRADLLAEAESQCDQLNARRR